ncbi:hypothetical protein ABT324_28220 [Saccharopolyspora sp. NPDC000359]
MSARRPSIVSALAEATRWLADLLAWHGRRRTEQERDRPPRPFQPRFKPR